MSAGTVLCRDFSAARENAKIRHPRPGPDTEIPKPLKPASVLLTHFSDYDLKNQPLCLKSGHFLTGFEWAGRCGTKSHVRLKISKCNLFKIAKIPRFVSTCVSFFSSQIQYLVVFCRCCEMSSNESNAEIEDCFGQWNRQRLKNQHHL